MKNKSSKRYSKPGWLALVLTIRGVIVILGLVILIVFFSVTRLAGNLLAYMADGAAWAAPSIPIASVFDGLFVWSFLLGGIGTLVSVTLMLLILTILEVFEGTQFLTMLMRFTGEEYKEESKEMIENLKEGWGKARGTITIRNQRSQENLPC